MNRRIIRLFILVLSISMGIISCNQGEKKEESTASTDSTGTPKNDTVQQAAQDAGMEALKAAPNLYKLLKDTMGIRVLEAIYKPRDTSVMHTHPDYAIYVIDGGTAQFTGKDGKKNSSEMKAGMANIKPAEIHSVKNTGKTTLKVLMVEVNRPRETIPLDPAMDATKVAPDLYKSLGDTLGIRVLEATYKPGQSSALHGHPDNAIYAINGGTAEFTEKDQTKHTIELKTGMATITAGGIHSVKNTGKTTIKVLMVEVNRYRK